VSDTDHAPQPREVEDDDVVDVDPDEEVLSAAYEIASYGADYPVDGLVKRMKQGDIVVPSFDPEFDDSSEVRGFQRRFVWSRPQMDRFIESLLLGLPVPGVFLVRERSNVLLVLDGQQRLKTLQAYYEGVHAGREYKLKHVQDDFIGRSYRELDAEDRRRLDDSIVHATVLRQEHPTGSQNSIYSIFERLNTGGSPLQPQEIRVALYHGSFLQLISRINEDPNWRELYGPVSARFKDQELLLRVFALYEGSDSYSRPVKGFLNNYLEKNRNRTDSAAEALSKRFIEACQLIAEHIGPQAFRPVRAINAAVLDSIMVGLMRRLDAGPVTDGPGLKSAYEALRRNKRYNEATTSSTAAEESVEDRLNEATDALQDVL
jgi:hypothetical protein